MRRMLLWLAIGMLGAAAPAAAVAGDITFFNCTAGNLDLRAYDSPDPLCWIASSSAGFGTCGSVRLVCPATTCKVKGVPGRAQDCGSLPSWGSGSKIAITKLGTSTKAALQNLMANYDEAAWKRHCECAEGDVNWSW